MAHTITTWAELDADEVLGKGDPEAADGTCRMVMASQDPRTHLRDLLCVALEDDDLSVASVLEDALTYVAARAARANADGLDSVGGIG